MLVSFAYNMNLLPLLAGGVVGVKAKDVVATPAVKIIFSVSIAAIAGLTGFVGATGKGLKALRIGAAWVAAILLVGAALGICVGRVCPILPQEFGGLRPRAAQLDLKVDSDRVRGKSATPRSCRSLLSIGSGSRADYRGPFSPPALLSPQS